MKNNLAGLAGAHRTGKTTLAREYAKRHDATFLKTDVSKSLASMGFTARDSLSLSERLQVQEIALNDCIAVWAQAKGECITDRTPLDLAMYTISEVTMGRANNMVEDYDATDYLLELYVERCLHAAEKYFGNIIVVQPGIKVVDDAKSAAPSKSYILNLSLTILGLANVSSSHIMPKDILQIEDRVVYCRNLLTHGMYSIESFSPSAA